MATTLCHLTTGSPGCSQRRRGWGTPVPIRSVCVYGWGWGEGAVFGNVDGFRAESPADGPIKNLCGHVPPFHSIGQVHFPELVTEMVDTPGLLSPTSKARALARGPGIPSELHHHHEGYLEQSS